MIETACCRKLNAAASLLFVSGILPPSSLFSSAFSVFFLFPFLFVRKWGWGIKPYWHDPGLLVKKKVLCIDSDTLNPVKFSGSIRWHHLHSPQHGAPCGIFVRMSAIKRGGGILTITNSGPSTTKQGEHTQESFSVNMLSHARQSYESYGVNSGSQPSLYQMVVLSASDQ